MNEAGTLDSRYYLMPHLDYVSCLLTVLSTVLVGRRKWQGWMVAGANSVIISAIGLRTGQWGFVPANIFCIAIYLYNIRKWRNGEEPVRSSAHSQTQVLSGTLDADADRCYRPRRLACRKNGKCVGDERLACNPIRPRPVPNRRQSRTPL